MGSINCPDGLKFGILCEPTRIPTCMNNHVVPTQLHNVVSILWYILRGINCPGRSRRARALVDACSADLKMHSGAAVMVLAFCTALLTLLAIGLSMVCLALAS